MNNTCGLGPKVHDIEKTPVFVAAAGEERIVSPHTGSWEGRVAIKPNPGII